MILSGYEGDEMNQPDWATGGSFMVFRDLQQLVPEYEKLDPFLPNLMEYLY